VGLGTAGNHVVLAKTAISSVPASALTGDIGVSPAAASFATGFSLVADSTNVFSTSTQVAGKVYAANYAVPTPSRLTTAVSNMESAYTDAAGRPTPDFLELGTGNIGGKTLAPGLYKWTSTVTIPTDVTIAGGANDVWIFQTTGDLTMAAAKNVLLSGGALPKNIFWQVAGQTTIGANSQRCRNVDFKDRYHPGSRERCERCWFAGSHRNRRSQSRPDRWQRRTRPRRRKDSAGRNLLHRSRRPEHGRRDAGPDHQHNRGRWHCLVPI
jgi:hypothetical protein